MQEAELGTIHTEAPETIAPRVHRERALRGTALPRDGLRDRIRDVLPLIARCAPEAERLRQPVDSVIEALEDTGVFRAFVPTKYGGYEIDIEEFIDIGVMIGTACASTAWVTTFYMEHNWGVATRFSADQVEAFFSRQAYLLAPGAVDPNGGVVTATEGGYELNGRWRFASGVVHGDWVMLNCKEAGKEGSPLPRTVLLPREDVVVEDTWDVDGMRGTGSHDIVARELFVPSSLISPEIPTPKRSDANPHSDMYGFPPGAFLPLTAAIPLIGAGKRAVEIYKESLTRRATMGSTTLLQDKVGAQMRLAHLTTEIAKAEAVLRAVGMEMEALSVRGRMASGRENLALQMMVAHAVRDCRNAVQGILEGAGAKVHFGDSELLRIHRDIGLASAHTVFDLDLGAERYGRALMKSHLRKRA